MSPPSSPTPADAHDVIALLQQQGALTAEQAEQARRRAMRGAVPLHQAIIDLGFASEEVVFRGLAQNQGLPFIALTGQDIPDAVKQRVPAKVAFHYRFAPLAIEHLTIRAAFASPPAAADRESLHLVLGFRLDPVIATPSDIMRTLKQAYGLGAETVLQIRQDRALQKRADKVTYDDFTGQDVSDADEETASIIHLVNQILLEALELQCTDIHLEPYPTTSRLRYRVDGMLRDIPTPPGIRELHEAIVTRLKVMANVNIAERRLPHDGRIRVRIGEEKFDLRMSVLPTRFGETLCLRILNREAIFRELDQMGFNPTQMTILNNLIDLPHGMVLMTGPTGSGKTTTLYAALSKVRDRSQDLKIITVEDPVEYELEGTSQVQVRADIGLTFASGLRSILRHDPDIILIGEIRDNETAEIAIRSALTGHLVLSTLHTNDSVGAVNRLVDMGIEPFLVGSSLIAALAQRLVRRICPHCKEPDPNLQPKIKAEIVESLNVKPEDVNAWVGRGCTECDQSGYRGRIAILEVFLLDEVMQDMVSRHAPTIELRATARESGMRSLRDSGWEKVLAGQTTVKEITRMTSSMQLSYNPVPAA